MRKNRALTPEGGGKRTVRGGVQNPLLGGVSFVRFSTPLFFPPPHGRPLMYYSLRLALQLTAHGFLAEGLVTCFFCMFVLSVFVLDRKIRCPDDLSICLNNTGQGEPKIHQSACRCMHPPARQTLRSQLTVLPSTASLMMLLLTPEPPLYLQYCV